MAWRLLGPDGDRWLARPGVSVTTRRPDSEGHARRADRLVHQASDEGGPGRCRQLKGQISRTAHPAAASEDYRDRSADKVELQGGRVHLHPGARRPFQDVMPRGH
jgi:hypothetical protein